jgi:hypothetical protein
LINVRRVDCFARAGLRGLGGPARRVVAGGVPAVASASASVEIVEGATSTPPESTQDSAQDGCVLVGPRADFVGVVHQCGGRVRHLDLMFFRCSSTGRAETDGGSGRKRKAESPEVRPTAEEEVSTAPDSAPVQPPGRLSGVDPPGSRAGKKYGYHLCIYIIDAPRSCGHVGSRDTEFASYLCCCAATIFDWIRRVGRG